MLFLIYFFLKVFIYGAVSKGDREEKLNKGMRKEDSTTAPHLGVKIYSIQNNYDLKY